MCERIEIPGGGFAFICGGRGRHKFCECGRSAVALCDWKVPDRKSGTCDAPICEKHRVTVAPGKDLCVFHQHAFEIWKKKHPDFDLRRGEQGNLFEGKA